MFESIFDGVKMLKSLKKQVETIDARLTGATYVEEALVHGHTETDSKGVKHYVAYDVPVVKDIEREIPSFKDVFTHDMHKFITTWNRIKNSVGVNTGDFHDLSKEVLDKILRMSGKDVCGIFSNVYQAISCNELTEQERKDFTNWLDCVIKAVIETSRRTAGLDVNGRYKDAYVIYTSFGMCHPGEYPNMSHRVQLVSRETAMKMYDGAESFKPALFKDME